MAAELNYTYDLQKFFLEMMIHDPDNYVRVQNIFNRHNFVQRLHSVAEFIENHSKQYNIVPEIAQIKAVTGVELEELPPRIVAEHSEWFLDEFERFTKRQELERAILKSTELLEQGEFGPVETLIKDAIQISRTRDLGTDYFNDPRSRLESIKSNNGQVQTQWQTLDSKLYGGMKKGELNIFAGGSGSGKSLFMQNLAVNWSRVGLNGVFLTLELSEDLCAMRIDSMVTGIASKEIFKKIGDIELQVGMAQKSSGSLYIKYLPAQSNCNDLRTYLQELRIKTGVRVDYICVDYLDLLMPMSVKVNPSDLFTKDKYVSEELRNLAKELDVVLVTASQLNRSAVDEPNLDHSHISGGISKINTADNVFGILTSYAMRERGKYQIQLLKTRSSAGVGQKIELDFDKDNLRITDPGIANQPNAANSPVVNKSFGNNINNAINNGGVVEDDSDDDQLSPMTVTASTSSSQIKRMIDTLQKF